MSERKHGMYDLIRCVSWDAMLCHVMHIVTHVHVRYLLNEWWKEKDTAKLPSYTEIVGEAPPPDVDDDDEEQHLDQQGTEGQDAADDSVCMAHGVAADVCMYVCMDGCMDV